MCKVVEPSKWSGVEVLREGKMECANSCMSAVEGDFCHWPNQG